MLAAIIWCVLVVCTFYVVSSSKPQFQVKTVELYQYCPVAPVKSREVLYGSWQEAVLKTSLASYLRERENQLVFIVFLTICTVN